LNLLTDSTPQLIINNQKLTMNTTINIGIDLGTTNSAIAKFIQGEVVVYNNPLDYGRSTLPSVVAYQKDRIVVGSQAKVLLGKQKQGTSVFALFKRKMGTSESFPIKAIEGSVTPIELSAQVLKELKTFVGQESSIEAAVITIPASFDLIQSNATKAAGHLAGFKQVILLQEPIAASLAYANMKKVQELSDGQWIVYDFGGGTFDVALVKIKDGDMKVVDHEGNNFLGGADIDQLVVEKIVLPRLISEYNFENLERDLKSASGKHNGKYNVLLARAEEAKIRLSAVTSTELTIDGISDDNGSEIDIEMIITRSELNEMLRAVVDETIEMIKKILVRNSLSSRDIQFTLMVGGSTYIPFVRQRVEEVLQIKVRNDVDPTTAIAIGAAQYAATKQLENTEHRQRRTQEARIAIKSSYNKASKERDELYSGRVSGDFVGLYYKITRQDGGYSSGLKNLTERISEDLPLVENEFNYFTLQVYDDQNNPIEADVELIGINSGYSISGQPLPEDICLEVDDYDNPGETRLMLLFQRNTTLPAKRTESFPLNMSLVKGSEHSKIRINVLQGSHTALPAANKSIGFIEVSGRHLKRDIAKGSDIEIQVTISESQDLTISAYLTMIDQEFKETFNPKERHTPVDVLVEQIHDLRCRIDGEIAQATDNEEYEIATGLTRLQREIVSVTNEADHLAIDDVTDKRYQLDDKKRKIAQEIDSMTKNKRVRKVIDMYSDTKGRCLTLIQKNGNDYDKKAFNDIVSQEPLFLSSNSVVKIQERADELESIIYRINWRTPEYLTNVFLWLKSEQTKMNDQSQAKNLISAGMFAAESENWDRLKEINYGLLSLLPNTTTQQIATKIGFGL
jgi:molecular chaperone DnaK